MLTNAGNVDGFRTAQFTDLGDHVLRGQESVCRGRPAERIGVAQRVELVPPGLEVRQAMLSVLVTQLDGQIGDDLEDVSHDGHVGHAVLGDLRRINVRVDHRCQRRETAELASHAVIEPGAESHHKVSTLQSSHGRHCSVHSGHAQVLRVGVGQSTSRHQRGDHRGAGDVGEGAERVARVATDHTTAHIQDGTARRREQTSCLAHLLEVRLRGRVIAREVQVNRPPEDGVGLLGALGNVHQHRTRTARAGDVEGLSDTRRDVIRVGHQEGVLGHRHRDTHDVGLLEGIRSDQGGAHLTRDGNHRDRVHVRIGEGGHQVGSPRTRGRHADANSTRRVGIARRRVPGSLLMPHQDVPQLLGIKQRVIGRQDGSTRDAENNVDARGFKGANDARGTVHPLTSDNGGRIPRCCKPGTARLHGPRGAGGHTAPSRG